MADARVARITVRLTPEEKLEWSEAASRSGKTLSDLVIERFRQPTVSQPSLDQKQVKADFKFFFTLFQRNAPVLSLSDEEREHVKSIIGRLRQS